MKLNIANPSTGAQKKILVEDEGKLRPFFDKRISQEVDGAVLGDEFKGYIFKIMGGCDKQGFPMKQGVLTSNRVKLLMSTKTQCFRGYNRRKGEFRRKSVRGCILSPDLSTINLVVVKQGDSDIPGLTDREVPRLRGPKRASKIRKLFNLTKVDDVRKYVNTYRQTKEKDGKTKSRAPKIQRLITPVVLQRKRARAAEKRNKIENSKEELAKYHQMIQQRIRDAREKHHDSVLARRAARSESKAEKR